MHLTRAINIAAVTIQTAKDDVIVRLNDYEAEVIGPGSRRHDTPCTVETKRGGNVSG